MAENSTKTLLDEGIALSMFLDTLLREPQPEPREAPPAAQAPVLEVVPTVTPAAPPVEVAHPAAEVEVAAEASVDNDRPAWAQETFQALLFKAGGLRLAVPLAELHGIVEWHDDITPMPGHADFYLGLLQHQDKTVPVIDTARFVLPADRLAKLAPDVAERITRIVLIDEARWGLACDEVERVVNLEPDQVRWRSAQTSRRWLAGTVVEHMCALLDGAAFAQLLARGRD